MKSLVVGEVGGRPLDIGYRVVEVGRGGVEVGRGHSPRTASFM
jgi:hypothetical protein